MLRGLFLFVGEDVNSRAIDAHVRALRIIL